MNSSPRIPQLALCPAQQSSSVKCKSKLKFKEVHRSAAPCCVPARGPWQAPSVAAECKANLSGVKLGSRGQIGSLGVLGSHHGET